MFSGTTGLSRTLWLLVWLSPLTCATLARAESPPGQEGEGSQVVRKKPDSSLLSQAQSYIRAGKHQDAYRLLKPQESELSGNPDYDYLLGVAALDSGRADEAVFILQRVVAVSPNYPAARMELARAYYETGDMAAAQREFERLRAANPPEFAGKVIGDYLSAIQKRNAAKSDDRGGRGWGAFVELGTGYDSNANGATERDQFLGFQLDANSRKQDAFFGQFAAAARYSAVLDEVWSANVGGYAQHRWNTQADFVNFDRAEVGGGLKWRKNITEVYGNVSYFQTYLDSNFPLTGDLNHRGGALDLGVASQLAPNTRLSADFRVGAIRYDSSQSIRDVNQYVGSLGAVFQISGPGSPVFGLVGVAGIDDEVKKASPYGRSLYGTRATSSWTVLEGLQANLQGGALRSDYEGDFFNKKRKDLQLLAAGSLDISNRRYPALMVSPYLLYVTNDSNTAIFEYDRAEVGVNLRWVLR